MTVMAEHKPSVTFRLPAEVLDELDEAAKRLGISRTDFIRLSVEAGLAVLHEAESGGASGFAALAELEAIKARRVD